LGAQASTAPLISLAIREFFFGAEHGAILPLRHPSLLSNLLALAHHNSIYAPDGIRFGFQMMDDRLRSKWREKRGRVDVYVSLKIKKFMVPSVYINSRKRENKCF
jgi:hypothetical protein